MDDADAPRPAGRLVYVRGQDGQPPWRRGFGECAAVREGEQVRIRALNRGTQLPLVTLEILISGDRLVNHVILEPADTTLRGTLHLETITESNGLLMGWVKATLP